MAKSKNHSVRRKGLRLLREASRNIVAERVRANRANANVVALRRGEETVFGMRTGLFGHPTTTVLRIPDEKVVGAVEDPNELGEIVTQAGMLVLAALFNYNLAWGTEGLAKRMAEWAGIDLEALKREAAEAAVAKAAEGGMVAEVDEDGDVIVRTPEHETAEAGGGLPGVNPDREPDMEPTNIDDDTLTNPYTGAHDDGYMDLGGES